LKSIHQGELGRRRVHERLHELRRTTLAPARDDDGVAVGGMGVRTGTLAPLAALEVLAVLGAATVTGWSARRRASHLPPAASTARALTPRTMAKVGAGHESRESRET
jgi:hypothetical protein